METEKKYFNLSKQIGASYFFNILIILFQPLLTALLTRTLSIEEYGTYSLLLATITLLSVLFRFGIVEYIRNKIPGLVEDTRIKTIIILLVFWFIFLLFMGVLLFLLKDLIINLLDIQNYTFVWLLSIFLIIFIALNDITESYLTSIKKIFVSSLFSFVSKCSWIIILLILFLSKSVHLSISLNSVFIIWLIGTIGSLFLAVYYLRFEFIYFLKNKLKFDLPILKTTLKFSLPLVFVISFNWIIEVSDRYLINYYLGKKEVAIYSIAYGLVTILISVPIIFQKVIQPYFSEKWNLGEDASIFFNIMLKYSLIIVLPAIVGMFVLRNELILLLSGKEYLPAAPLLVVLLPISLFAVIKYIFDKTMFLRDMIKSMILIYLIAATVNILFNLYFIPRIGTIAAAYSTVISYFLILLIMFFLRPKKIKIKFNYLKLARILMASILMGLVIILVNPVQHWQTIIMIVSGGIIYILLLFTLGVFNLEERKLIYFIYSQSKTKLGNNWRKK